MLPDLLASPELPATVRVTVLKLVAVTSSKPRVKSIFDLLGPLKRFVCSKLSISQKKNKIKMLHASIFIRFGFFVDNAHPALQTLASPFGHCAH